MAKKNSLAASDVSAVRGAVLRLARRLRQQRSVATMTDAQFAVLAILSPGDALSLGSLAERECVTAPSMNRTVNGLVDLGYLSRTENDEDRRKVDIRITDEGHRVVSETVHRRDEWLAKLLDRLSDDERQKFRDVADIIVREVRR